MHQSVYKNRLQFIAWTARRYIRYRPKADPAARLGATKIGR